MTRKILDCSTYISLLFVIGLAYTECLYQFAGGVI